MKLTMKKTALAVTMGLAFGAAVPAANAALVLDFANGTAVAAKAGPCSAIAWTAGNEFRMCSPAGVLGGGAPLQKDTMLGSEFYHFSDANLLTGTAYGAASYAGGVPVAGMGVPFITAPVLEAQWGGTWFPLGSAFVGAVGIDTALGLNFVADITSVVTVGSVTTFSFHMYANELIDASEDPGSAGFAGWAAPWHPQGTGTYTAPNAIPVPAAVWLFGSGLLGLVGIARRKKKA